MANAVYQKYKQALLTNGSTNISLDQDTATDGPFCSLVDTGTYTFSQTHQFFSPDLTGIQGTDQRITVPTVTNGTFDGNDLTYTAVTGVSIEALVVYRKNSGANTTWRLVLYEDTGVTGLPVTPNGGNITVTWNVSGIFTISDKDMKEAIREIGKINGLSLCEYRYKGSRKKHVGFIAQDVERKLPQAVRKFDGRKMVNYQMVLDWAEAA